MRIEDVVNNHICTGCGSCYGICAFDAISIVETIDGRLAPILDKDICTECGLCHLVCPQIQTPAKEDKSQFERFIEPRGEGYLGRPTDKSVHMKGQTVGLVRTLLAFALESGYADKILCVVDNENKPLRPHIDVITSLDDFDRISKSKYCPINFGEAIKYIRQNDGNYIVVGTGCQLQGLNLVMDKNKRIKNRVKLTIGLFCDRILKYNGTHFLVNKSDIAPNNISKFTFKDKYWKGYPGDVRVTDKSGHHYDIEREWRIKIWDIFSPLACRLCPNKLNNYSDISIGDPWGFNWKDGVYSSVITKKKNGRDLLLLAHEHNIIELLKCDVKDIAKGQNITVNCSTALTFKCLMQKKQFLIPANLNHDEFNTIKRSNKIKNRFYFKLSLYFETEKGVEFLNKHSHQLAVTLDRYKKIVSFPKKTAISIIKFILRPILQLKKQ